MNRDRFSFIAHTHRAICNPLSFDKLDGVIARLELPENAAAIDIGCGKAELLIRLAHAWGHRGDRGVRAVGVERSPLFAADAQRRVNDAGFAEHIAIHETDALAWLNANPAQRFDLACCTGSLHALGGYEPTLRTLLDRLNPAGWLLIAEGFWAKPPAPEYLKFLGDDESQFTTHAGNIERAIALGLTPHFAATATTDEWDDYEWTYSSTIESHVRENPDDPDASEMLARIRPWREAYLTWGRETLGFGVYLFRAP